MSAYLPLSCAYSAGKGEIALQLYQTLYHLVFNAVTDAIRALDDADVPAARDILIRAQRDAERRYLDETESNDGI